MTRHFDYCPSASEGDNQSVRSSAPVVSRCFPRGYNVKLYISRGRLSMVVTGFFAQWKLTWSRKYKDGKLDVFKDYNQYSCKSNGKSTMTIGWHSIGQRRADTRLTFLYKYTKILEVNLFTFAYRLFHRDFSPINGTLHYIAYKSSPSSTLPLVIPEYTWIVLFLYKYVYGLVAIDLCNTLVPRQESCVMVTPCPTFPLLILKIT